MDHDADRGRGADQHGRPGTLHGQHFHRKALAIAEYEAVYFQDIADGFEAARVVENWIDFYDRQRPHSAPGLRTPEEAYKARTEQTEAA